MKNPKDDEDLKLINSLSKNITGSLIDQIEVSNFDLPGIFGIKILENMPINLRDVYSYPFQNKDLGAPCDPRLSIIPNLIDTESVIEYIPEEDSDFANEFEV